MPRSHRTIVARRFAQILILALLASSLSGCVYLRLLKFKNQLKDFDAQVQVDHSSGLALQMRHPVLRDSDFVFLTESRPTNIVTLSTSPRIERWHWVFEKKSENEADSFNIVFQTRFEEGLLTRIDFDPQLLEAIPEDFIVELFRSLGNASINKLRRSATAKMSRDTLENVPLPTLAEIEETMGLPTQRNREGERRDWNYVFNFYNPENRSLSGQFNIVFKSDSQELGKQISGFEVSGKAR